jgi:DNA-binding transcriptional LysR family regulator
MLSLYQLHIFVLVAEAKTISGAAEQLHLTQPAVSQQIRSLERSLQMTLFVRRGHRMDPTVAARALLPIARDLVQLAELTEELIGTIRSGGTVARGKWRNRSSRVQEALKETEAQLANQVSLGCGTHFGVDGIYRVVRAFRDTLPGVILSIEHDSAEAILRRVREKSLDAALVDQRPRERGLRSQRILSDEIVLVVPAGHPWAHGGSIRAADLAGQPVVAQPREADGWRLAAEALDRQRIQLDQLPMSIHVDSPHDAIAAVGQGLGISFVPKGIARAFSGSAAVVQIDGVTVRRDIFLVYGAEGSRTEAGRRLEAFLRSPQAAKLLAGEG